MSEHTNLLIHETSPYLLQHAHNPVNWEPWSQAAFDRARAENKLVIVSIGYSACHWCHVMEHESFEDETVARLMNENYICIKVDREERPDVDQMYMDAAQLMIGRGGWPLNAFALPDGRPVYAGTYFQKTPWTGLLKEISYGYKKQPEKYHEYADKLIAGIKGLSLIKKPETDEPFTMDDLHEAYNYFSHAIDRTWGGRGRAPKFPMPHNWLFMLRYHHLTGNEQALQLTLLTLDKMAQGGIYDQLGGGFARYSTDQQWKVPHFEKMLYDNAQLLSVYAEAYTITGKELYKEIVYGTVAFMQRELMAENGAFYCALDADSEGEEGKFYVWSENEFDAVTGTDAAIMKEWYGIGREGYWEHGNSVPVTPHSPMDMAARHNITLAALQHIISTNKQKLFDARSSRIRPGLDNKILLSWNALAIKGLLDAYKAFGDRHFFELAGKTLQFVSENMEKAGKLFHSYQKNEAGIPGFLEDYSLYIETLFCWYQASFDAEALHKARKMLDDTIEHFFDEESGFFWFTSMANNELPARKIETSDNVIPAANSVMAHNLFNASIYFGNPGYKEKAVRMLGSMKPVILEHAAFYSNWAILATYLAGPFYEVVFTGAAAETNLTAFQKTYMPNKITAGFLTDMAHSSLPLLQHKGMAGRSLIYICENYACLQPAENVADAMAQVKPL